MSRLQGCHTVEDAVNNLIGGSHHNAVVLGMLIGFAGESVVRKLDDLEIYGDNIWHLANRVCNQDIRQMFACLLAVEEGFITADDLRIAIDQGENHGLNIDALVASVEVLLPKSDGCSGLELGL